MKRGLSAYTVVRNALSLDYCVHLTIQSLLPVADEVVVCDASSDDGTTQMLHVMAALHPKVRVVTMPWGNPTARITWFVEWINYARGHLRFDRQLMLDADEVLDPGAIPILNSNPPPKLTFHRLNYWRDVRHVAPHGRCCSHLVARYGPTKLYMTSDEIYNSPQFPGPEPEIRRESMEHPGLVIHHYGFLRKREALFDKCKVVLNAFNGSYDQRLVEAANDPSKPWQDFCEFDLPLVKCNVKQPEFVKAWLKERNVL